MPISDPATITSTFSPDAWSYDPERHDDELERQRAAVTSQIRLKPGGDPSQKIDKQVVLRRIRQRQRVNKVKGALNALFSTSPFSSYYSSSTVSTKKSGGDCGVEDDDGRKSGGRKSGGRKVGSDLTVQRWVDDAFAAL